MKITLNELKRIVRQTIRESTGDGKWTLTLEFSSLKDLIEFGLNGNKEIWDWWASDTTVQPAPTLEDLLDAQPEGYNEDDWFEDADSIVTRLGYEGSSDPEKHMDQFDRDNEEFDRSMSAMQNQRGAGRSKKKG